MKRTITFVTILAAAIGIVIAQDDKNDKKKEESPPVAEPTVESPKGAKVYIITPRDGATLKKQKVLVRFGLKNMGIAPAGIKFPNTGHHHLLIDDPKYDAKLPLVMTDQIKHFGAGQTEAIIELKPGKHTLQLVLGDYLHRLHNPPVISKKITVTVPE